MTLHTLLYRRGAVYYFRQRVPLELVPYIGKKELCFSLATADPKAAIKRLRAVAVKVAEQFESLQSGNNFQLELDSFSIHERSNPTILKQAPMAKNLRALFDEWKQSHIEARNLKSQSTYDEWDLAVRQFNELHGDLPLASIKKEHVKVFRKNLGLMPRALNKETRALPFKQIIQLSSDGKLSDKKISPATITKRITALSSLFDFAIQNDYIEHNPAKGLRFPKESHNKQKARVEYSRGDIKTIFNSPIFTGCDSYYRAKVGEHKIKDARYS